MGGLLFLVKPLGFKPSPRARTDTDERSGPGHPGDRQILVCQVQTLGYYFKRNFPEQESGVRKDVYCGEELLRLT